MPNYPGTQNTDDNLYIGVNNLSTVLTDNPLTAGATTVNVSNTTGFPTVGIITIDLEAIHYTGITATSFTGCTRGFDGTTGAPHPVSTTVFHDTPAAHHNVLKDEIKAISDDLRDAFTADLDDAATIAATATDVKERLDQIVTQVKNLTGESDWKTAPADTLSGLSTELTSIQSDLDDAVTAVASAADLNVRLNHIATQLKAISGETDWKTVPTTALNNMLPLSGGTMSGNIAMGSNILTGLSAGTVAGNSIRFEQLKILQIVSSTSDTSFTTTSASFQDSNLTVSITPSSTSSKILILVSGAATAAVPTTRGIITLERDSTNIGNGNEGFQSVYYAGGSLTTLTTPCSISYVDSPAKATSTVYTVQVRSTSGGNNVSFGTNGARQSIIAIEINGI